MTWLRLGGVERVLASAQRRFVLRVERFHVEAGEAVALIGPSGSGKSAMLELLGLIGAPRPGGRFVLDRAGDQVDLGALWAARDLRGLADLRAGVFGFVLQTGGLLPFLTAAANARLTQTLSGRIDAPWIADLAARLGLDGVMGARPAQLSIGQRQRVAILRALAHRPAIVIADEPTSALDPGAAEGVMGLFLDLARETGTAVVLSTHNVDLAARRGLSLVPLTPLGESGGAWVAQIDRAP